MGGAMQSQWHQIPHPLGGQPTNWKIIVLQKFPHWSESPEPHIRLPSLREAGGAAVKDSGVWSQELHRTGGENKRYILRVNTKSQAHPYPEEQSRDPWESGTDLPAGVGGSHAEGGGGWLTVGDKDAGSRSSGKYSLAGALLEATMSTTKQPVVFWAVSPQDKPLMEGNTAPPISSHAA